MSDHGPVQDSACIPGQQQEEIEFPLRETDLDPSLPDGVFSHVYFQITQLDTLSLANDLSLSPQAGLYSGREFQVIERLNQIVVSPGFQPQNFIGETDLSRST